MPLRRLFFTVITLTLSLVVHSAHADSFVYTVANHFANFQVDGTITTDTNDGVLSYSDITDFNLLLFANGASDTLTPPNTDNNGLYGYGLTATSTGLFFNYDQPFALFFLSNTATGTAVCFQTEGCGGPEVPNELVQIANNDALTEEQTGNVQIGAMAVTPEPSTFVLLLTGIAAAIAFGRYRSIAA